MTRFARAKGSKASNERAPEDATPWEVMKEQLLQAKIDGEHAKKRLEAEQQRVENYENFLKEQKVQKRQASWCDFPETKTDSKKPKFQHDKKKVSEHTVGNQHSENHFQRASGTATTSYEETDKTSSVNNDKTTKKKKSKNNKEKTSSLHDAAPAEKVNESNKDETKPQDAIDDQDMSKKKAKKNKKTKNSDTANSTESSKTDDNKLEKPGDQPNKGQNQTKVSKKKKKKLVDGKPVRRKAENDSSFQLIINGKEVELVRFEGFPIMRKDADRLQDLKNNMIRRGIPKSEVQRTIKLERRRAEKALARLKRDVCYNCRKGGHNLSDCPELKSKIPGENGADGVCFKCGSTEHRQFECKVQKDKEFRFASCFICREQGHIARQCPDNPKGLYPNGGGCKLCGDVTHLRKDCPTDQDKRVESTVKLPTLESVDNIEDIEQQQAVKPTESVKKPKKIKF